jgi:hypothetical protein
MGAPGVAWGLAAAEMAVLAVQLWKLAPRLRPAVTVGSERPAVAGPTDFPGEHQ